MYYSPSLFPLPNPCSLSSLFATHTLDIPNAIITSPYLILSFLYAYATTAEKKLQTHTHDTISMQKVKENTPFIIPTCIIHLKKRLHTPIPFLCSLYSLPSYLCIYMRLLKKKYPTSYTNNRPLSCSMEVCVTHDFIIILIIISLSYNIARLW